MLQIHPSLMLQKSIHHRLSVDQPLAILLGGQKIFDYVPQATKEPYVSFASIETSDWSSQTDRGYEHIVSLHIWSRARGRKQTYEIMALIDAALNNADLNIQPYRLITLRTIFWSVMTPNEAGLYRGLMRLRAVSEQNEY